jgi:hypothetical protein
MEANYYQQLLQNSKDICTAMHVPDDPQIFYSIPANLATQVIP